MLLVNLLLWLSLEMKLVEVRVVPHGWRSTSASLVSDIFVILQAVDRVPLLQCSMEISTMAFGHITHQQSHRLASYPHDSTRLLYM